jgi:hypothetical protein
VLANVLQDLSHLAPSQLSNSKPEHFVSSRSVMQVSVPIAIPIPVSSCLIWPRAFLALASVGGNSNKILILGYKKPIPVAARFNAHAVARSLRLCVRIPPEAWTSVSSECCVLSD